MCPIEEKFVICPRNDGAERSLVGQLAADGCDEKTISTMASDLMFGGEEMVDG